MILNRIIDAKYTKFKYNLTQLCIFYISGGHFEYFKLLEGGNMPPTWNCSLGPYR